MNMEGKQGRGQPGQGFGLEPGERETEANTNAPVHIQTHMEEGRVHCEWHFRNHFSLLRRSYFEAAVFELFG